MDQRARLPRAGARDDEERPVSKGGGTGLIHVQRRGELLLAGGGDFPLARAIEAWTVVHAANIALGPNGCRRRQDGQKVRPSPARSSADEAPTHRASLDRG